MDYDYFNSFLKRHDISENILFSSVFAYTLSRFVGSEKVLFNIIDNGRDRFQNYDSIGMFVNTLPLLVDCTNQNVDSFLDYMSDMVYGVMKYNFYPFRFLANKYDINSNIIFQFIPEWIRDSGEFDEVTVADDDIIGNMDDLIADLTVEVVQRGRAYVLSVMYSDKYSGVFIDRFIKSFKLILHGMLDANDLSEIICVSDSDIQLLDSYNSTEHDLVYCDVLDAFNDNLFRCPDSALVSMYDSFYSYGEGAFMLVMLLAF